MRLKNILLVVNDIELSKIFYKDLFGLNIVTDFGEKVILTEGLVLHERRAWEAFTQKNASFGGHDAELYFEENDMGGFLDKLEKSSFSIEYIKKPGDNDQERRVIQFYDPDRHVIEVAERMAE